MDVTDTVPLGTKRRDETETEMISKLCFEAVQFEPLDRQRAKGSTGGSLFIFDQPR